MLSLLRRVIRPTRDLSPAERRVLWRGPFLRSYAVVLFAYTAMYIIRKNFNIAQNELIAEYHFTKTDLGVIGFWFSITYGIGKTVVGYFGDGKNTKNVIALLLILASVAMMGFGLVAGSLGAMTLFYALNGFFQSGGGPAAYSTIARWVPQRFRGTALGAWNISHNLGGALAASVALFGSHVIFGGDLRGMFLFPAIVAMLIGLASLFIGAESPEAYGLGRSEEIFEETPAAEDAAAESEAYTKWQIFTRFVLGNPSSGRCASPMSSSTSSASASINGASSTPMRCSAFPPTTRAAASRSSSSARFSRWPGECSRTLPAAVARSPRC